MALHKGTKKDQKFHCVLFFSHKIVPMCTLSLSNSDQVTIEECIKN